MSQLTGQLKTLVGRSDSRVEARREAAAWAEIARKLNNIYTDYGIVGHKVEISDQAYAPGWTDMKDVFLSEDHLVDLRGKLDRDVYLAAVKGLTFHELFHLLYSPTGQWRKDIGDNGLNTAWNILEDQRIESLGTVVWPRMGRLIAVTVAEFILKGEQGDASWPLLIGRRYLPVSLRTEYRDKWLAATGAPATVADELEDIVTEYVGLVHPADNDRAVELIVRFADLLALWPLPNYGNYDSLDGHTSKGRGSGARPVRKQKKDAAKAKDEAQDDLDAQRQDRADKDADKGAGADDGNDDKDDDGQDGDGQGGGDKDADKDATDKAGGTGDDDGDGDDGTGDDIGDGTGGDDKDATDTSDDGDAPGGDSGGDGGTDTDGDTDNPGKGPGGHGAGNGDKDDAPENWNDITSVDDLIDSVLSDYADEINDAGAALDKTKSNLPAWVGTDQHKVQWFRPPAPASRTLARRITKVLRQAQDDAAAGRLRGQRSGRVNVRKVGAELADPQGNRDLFDRWVDDAAQDVSAEVVVLVDTSGSTFGMEAQYAEALWVLKKGLEDANVPTTVATFSYGAELLWRGGPLKGQAANSVPRLDVGGGTSPAGALHEARQQLRRSDAAIRMIVVLTDGAWDHGVTAARAPDTTLAAANADGITTVLVGFGQAVKHYGTHNCQYARDLTDPRDMIPLLTAAINRRMVAAIKDRES